MYLFYCLVFLYSIKSSTYSEATAISAQSLLEDDFDELEKFNSLKQQENYEILKSTIKKSSKDIKGIEIYMKIPKKCELDISPNENNIDGKYTERIIQASGINKGSSLMKLSTFLSLFEGCDTDDVMINVDLFCEEYVLERLKISDDEDLKKNDFVCEQYGDVSTSSDLKRSDSFGCNNHFENENEKVFCEKSDRKTKKEYESESDKTQIKQNEHYEDHIKINIADSSSEFQESEDKDFIRVNLIGDDIDTFSGELSSKKTEFTTSYENFTPDLNDFSHELDEIENNARYIKEKPSGISEQDDNDLIICTNEVKQDANSSTFGKYGVRTRKLFFESLSDNSNKKDENKRNFKIKSNITLNLNKYIEEIDKLQGESHDIPVIKNDDDDAKANPILNNTTIYEHESIKGVSSDESNIVWTNNNEGDSKIHSNEKRKIYKKNRFKYI